MQYCYENLTERQVEIYDILAECESFEEVKFVLDYVLPNSERTCALTLIEIMHMDNYEYNCGLYEVEYEVVLFLEKIMNKNKN